MADYFISDIHLRLDAPDRAERLTQFVDTLTACDRLWIVGDLCDFWMASRQSQIEPPDCAGLSALVRFQKRGGPLEILLGNHDAWMGPAYQAWFGINITPEPLESVSHGLRLVVSHGHRVRGKSWWKAAMESRAFLAAFQRAPESIARALDRRLTTSNERTRTESEPRMISVYREMADKLASCDLAIFGHVHRVHDDASRRPRLVVLGDWSESINFLRLDDSGAKHQASLS